MKKIDFIYKNFDVNAFSKNLKKIKSSVILSLSDYLSQIVISSTRDISQIKKEINYYQFTKDKPNDELSKACVDFLKKYKEKFSNKDIEKYFYHLEPIFTKISDFENGKNVDDYLETEVCQDHFKRLN